MERTSDKTVATLNDLIEIAEDGQRGYNEAAEHVKDADLKTLFLQYANERAQFVRDLQSQVAALGGKPQTSGTAAGAMHRGWIDLKAAFSRHDDHAVLEECERGEDAAKETYEKAVAEGDLSGTIASIVKAQSAKVRAAHDRVRDLRDGVGIPIRR